MRLPQLGPRGEGWVVAQLMVAGAILVLGALELPRLLAGGPLRWGSLLAGAALLVAGGATAARGARDLGESLTPMPRPRDDARLVEDGIYAVIRHPIYAGVIGICFGWSLFTGSALALLGSAVEALIFVAKSSLEEDWLLRRYPGYAAYRARTHRFLPGIC